MSGWLNAFLVALHVVSLWPCKRTYVVELQKLPLTAHLRCTKSPRGQPYFNALWQAIILRKPRKPARVLQKLTLSNRACAVQATDRRIDGRHVGVFVTCNNLVGQRGAELCYTTGRVRKLVLQRQNLPFHFLLACAYMQPFSCALCILHHAVQPTQTVPTMQQSCNV